MTNELKLIISGDSSRINEALTRSGRKISSFGSHTTRVFNSIGRTIQQVNDRISGFVPLGTAAGLTLAGKAAIDLDARLVRLTNQAGITNREMFALKQELFEASRKTNQLPTNLLSGMEQIVEKTGDIKLAKDTLLDMGIAASATGSEMEAIGSVTSNLNEKLRITKDEMKGAFDVLYAQGNKGAFTMKDLSMLGERLFSSAASFGVRGISGLRQFGAFVQIAKRSGTSEMATTSVERTVADLLQKASQIKTVTGFSIFDEEASRREGRAVTKNLDVVLKEIILRTKGDTVKLRKIFGEESIRAMDQMADSFRKFGDFREYDEFVRTGGDGVETMKAYARWIETAAAKMERFNAEMMKLTNETLAGPIEAFTKALDVLNNHPVITKGGLWALLGLTGSVGIGKLALFVKEIMDTIRGKRGGMPGGTGFPGGMTGPIPVYIVNAPLPKLPGANPLPGGGGGTTQKIKEWLKTLWPTILKGGEKLGERALPFARYGAKGAFPLSVLSELVFPDAIGTEPTVPQGKDYRSEPNNQTQNIINITVDKDRRTIVDSNNMNTKINLKRGKF